MSDTKARYDFYDGTMPLRLPASVVVLMLLAGCIGLPLAGADSCKAVQIDMTVAKQLSAMLREGKPQGEMEELALRAQKTLGEFELLEGEEVFTSRSFPVAQGLVLNITAYHTDESMLSRNQDKMMQDSSLLIALALTRRVEKNTFAVPGNAVAELTYNQHTNTVRVKQLYRRNGRLLLFQVECTMPLEGQ